MCEIELCSEKALVEGQATGFDPFDEGHDTVFALLHEKEVRVYRNVCPHLLVAMEYRKDKFMSADGQWVVCYAHGARFRPLDGMCVYGPCLGLSLERIASRLVDGRLMISIEDASEVEF
ncbi:Rieske (2Fe-2S) protein [Pseudomonas syringae]|uniref:Rieske (2Fe-2S) protein n=1 Tax=Pseudomonas syringae TaxID=317 RepID=UPI001F2FF6DD|nr:Rieske 2Fe-2S domain-containing protein [Pseudomonas syringae]MCF5722810.1 Rieske 2Fe-2S domain-containing protein [Pseudomonas syringae]